jgi:hypothetical protein
MRGRNQSLNIMPPKKKAVVTKEKAYEFAKKNKNFTDIVQYIREHPDDLRDMPVKWSILHQIVFNGNVDLLKEIIDIPQVYIPLDFRVLDIFAFEDFILFL